MLISILLHYGIGSILNIGNQKHSFYAATPIFYITY